jgi:hypothetical protein
LQEDCNNTKQQIEMRLATSTGTFQALAVKTQHAQARLSRAESRRKEANDENKTLMSRLKQEITDLHNRLHAAIQDALSAQKIMLEEEERQKEEQRRAEAAANPELSKSGKKKKNPRKGKKAAKSELEQPPPTEATPPPASPQAKAASGAKSALAKTKPK